MRWWNGQGAVKVIRWEADALLMERAKGARSLIQMSENNQDDEASQIICNTAKKLHSQQMIGTIPEFIPLEIWFRNLEVAANDNHFLRNSFIVARELLANPLEIVPLHGDLHHGNILDSQHKGWLAIDPKGLLGDRAYDFANIFFNPNDKIACFPGRLKRQAMIVAESAGLGFELLMKWIAAYGGLSAAWLIEEEKDPAANIAILEMVMSELDN